VGFLLNNTDIIRFKVNGSLETVGSKLSTIARQLGAEVTQLESASGALGKFDDHADIEVLLEGTTGVMVFHGWAVQVHVVDADSSCDVALVALDSNIFGRMANKSGKYLPSLSASLKQREKIRAALLE